MPATSNSTPGDKQPHTKTPSFFHIKIYPTRDLPQQAFLPELSDVVNASYGEHTGKHTTRLTTDTQLTDEVGVDGFTAVATSNISREIVGTASVKAWVADAGGLSWTIPGSSSSPSSSSPGAPDTDGSEGGICEGDYEILLVAVKPGVEYRKKGIAESLVQACEEEVKRRYLLSRAEGRVPEKANLGILLKVVREINGAYWLKKGFRVVGECYCPAFTWDLKEAFVLWAMRRDLVVG